MKPKPTLLSAATAVAALSLLAFSACDSTSVNTTWTAPDISKIHFNKIMVVATFPDGATRRAAEDTFKAQITRAECVTSYSLLGANNDLKDVTKVSAALKAAGVDGVVVMRPVSDKKEITYIPGAGYPESYRTFRGYYSSGYALSPFFYEPGWFTTDRIVQIETNIYEAAGERLIWSASTTSTNPGNVQELIKEATAVIRAELVKEKLITVPAPPSPAAAGETRTNSGKSASSQTQDGSRAGPTSEETRTQWVCLSGRTATSVIAEVRRAIFWT